MKITDVKKYGNGYSRVTVSFCGYVLEDFFNDENVIWVKDFEKYLSVILGDNTARKILAVKSIKEIGRNYYIAFPSTSDKTFYQDEIVRVCIEEYINSGKPDVELMKYLLLEINRPDMTEF